jgi:CubicO group peptidase (beta-lactamase class C family)
MDFFHAYGMKRILMLLLTACIAVASCKEEDEDSPVEETIVETPTAEAPDTVSTSDTTSAPADTTTTPPTPAPPLGVYFPSGDAWETITPEALKWNVDSLAMLLDFLADKNTYGFIVLYKGRIVTEKYWNGWDHDTRYLIASAGKSITAFLIGVAQQEGLLKISDPVSKFLGAGWTSLSPEKENLITIQHLLSMTSGLDETEDFCTSAECLTYKADAGKRWAYHNGPYNLLHRILEKSGGVSMNEYTKTRLAASIGMKNWNWNEYNLELNTRDMARFGLLISRKGKWNGSALMTNDQYFNSMVSSSNGLNKSYGYLWWLNGKDSYMVPGEADVKSGSLTPPAPPDMFAAMGKGDKKIYVVPAKNLVIVRHGDDTGTTTFGPSSFDSELWRRLNAVIASMPDNL